MTTLPAVSGAECVRALMRAGFRPIGSASPPTILERDAQAVVAPDIPMMDGEALAFIMRAAGLTRPLFVELLDCASARPSAPPAFARSALGCPTMIRPPLEPARAQPEFDEPRRYRGSTSSWPPGIGKRRRQTVLIVEDSQDTREVYVWCMRAAGWVVEAVPSGEEALLVAAVLVPDVIVMDLHLPFIDGLEATRRLKADPDTRHIPVLAISGIDRQGGAALATEAGCDAFLAKPCQPDQLRALLEGLAAGHQAGPS